MGTIANTVSVIVGSLIGLWLGKRLPTNLGQAAMKSLALCTLYLGITGFKSETHALLLIISMVIGSIVGEWANLDGHLNQFGDYLKGKFSSDSASNYDNFTQAFVTATVLWCAGAMTIVGCLQDGMTGDHTILYAKSALDLVSAALFASSLGVGVLAASVSLFAIQGSLTLLASFLAPYFSDIVIADISTVGSLLLIALALNMLELTKLKVVNLLPACAMPIILHLPIFAKLFA